MSRLPRWSPAWVLLGALGWRFVPDGAVKVGVGFGALAVAAAAVLLAIRLPAAAAGFAVAVAAYVGGYAVLAAAPAVLLLGYRASASFRPGPAPGRWRWPAAAALLAALATLPFARLGYERHGTGGDSASLLTPRPEGAAAPGDGSRLGDGLEALLLRLVRPESNPRWWLLALLVALLLALVAVGMWLTLRRWRRPAPEPDTVPAVERLEAVGRRIGRRRRPDEGMLGYASALADRSDDSRLDAAGPAVSALVYRSRAASMARVEQALEALEASPPPRPPRSWSLSETVRRVRSRLGFPVVAAGAAAALVIIGAVGVVVPRLSDLEADEAGPWMLWTEPPSSVEQWWSCAISDEEAVARTGVDHLTRERSATHTRQTIDSTTVFEMDEGTWDGESVMAYDGVDEFPVEGELVRPWRPFVDLDGVLRSFGITEPVVTTHRDATGAVYTRYESMPLVEAEEGLVGVEHLGARWETSVVWVLDVWLDGNGRPVRLRQMIDGGSSRWEWLLLDQPTGDSTPPGCGIDAGPSTGSPRRGPWLGSEPWAATLEVPLQVAYDPDGHPYDLTWWSADGTWSALGSLRSPGGTATFSALELLDVGTDSDGSIETVNVAPGSTVRVDHYAAEAGDGHRMVLSSPDGASGPVVAWRLLGEVDLIELTPVIVVVPSDIDAERIEAAYGELDIDDYVGDQLDLDDDGVDDTMVLADYGGLTRVYAGEDAAGRVVELAAVTDDLPWRVLGLPGEAPADVLEREQELVDCAAGLRPIGRDGVCLR